MKKNFRKTPNSILIKVKNIQNDDVVIFGVSSLYTIDIKNEKYNHLSISIENENISFNETIIPDKKQGKHSNWNINGREIKRKDLPKETFYNYVEAPNWGDSSNGTHIVALPCERYPIEFIPPRFSSIKVELLKILQNSFVFKFTLSEVLNKKDGNFKDRLFDCINLIQENIGVCDVSESGVTDEQYLLTHTISWEILPPGEKGIFINKLFSGRKYTPQEQQTAESRYDFFIKLKPIEMILGLNGFQRYFGAKIDNNLVLFENTDYGNALYIMYSNWEEMSRKSRIELLSGRYGKDFDRIIHTGDWKEKTKALLKDKKR